MRTTTPRPLLIACAALAATTGCLFPSAPGDHGGDFDLCRTRITRVAFDVPSVTLRVGDTATVVATPLDPSGSGHFLCPVEWSSSNEAVVRPVDVPVGFGKGLVGVGPGSAWIRATSKGRTDSVLVTMSVAPVASVTVEMPSSTLLVGQTMRVVAVARDSAGNVLPVRRVQWTTSSGALQVLARGLVLARATGNASVRATIEGVTGSVAIPTSRAAPAIGFADLSAGVSHSCALVGGGGKAAGSAYCWGTGAMGQLGTGDLATREFPAAVTGATAFTRISAGDSHTCAESADGGVHCWGANGRGQLGDGGTGMRLVPTRVAYAAPLHGVAAGGEFTCALEADGVASCWGA